MSIVRWNPGRDLSAFPSDMLGMQREINRMFDSFFRGGTVDEEGMVASSWIPAVEIVEKDDAYVVKMEIPGVGKDDVKITMQDSVLTIKGEKRRGKETKGSNYHREERSYGMFQRSFTLPTGVKTEAIDATYRDGILEITLPKAEQARQKQIDVKIT